MTKLYFLGEYRENKKEKKKFTDNKYFNLYQHAPCREKEDATKL
jgi:hypothetical protein